MSDELGEEEIEVCATANEIQSTYPLATNLSVSGPFEDEDHARGFGHAFIGSLQVIGQHINLTDLDGVTITGTYHETLLQIDRGLEGLRPLTASTIEDGVIGVAMAPALL